MLLDPHSRHSVQVDRAIVTDNDIEALALAVARARRHPAGKPFSATTYTNHACRCDGCTAASTAYQAKWRTEHPDAAAAEARRQQYRHRAAWQWVRANHPDIAAGINDEARKAHP